MLRTNSHNCVIQSVIGAIAHPRIPLKNPYLVDQGGGVHILPGVGGITYNVAVGDSAFSFAGDHVEPGVSMTLDEREKDGASLGALCILACIGNEARVVSGEAVHARGFVTGKHGGVEHVLVDFAPSVLDKLAVGDRIQIKAVGQGIELTDFPDVRVMSLSPALLQKLGIVVRDGRLVVPVTHVVPAAIMGSGTGSRHSFSGDYDIQVADEALTRKHGLESLRLGDVVAIRDADCRFGRSIRSGAIAIGVVVHASCVVSGHGPGVTVIMTTAKKLMVPKMNRNANIANYLGIGRFHRPVSSGRRRGK